MKRLSILLLALIFISSCKKENCTIDKGAVIAIQHWDFPPQTTMVIIKGFCNHNIVDAEAYMPDSMANCIHIGTYYTGAKNYCDTTGQ